MERAARSGKVIIMGDFNYPEIDWINGKGKGVAV